ncbi:hypothetical protein Ccrd_020098 [Cynara cardunculus var. scolymus]|uniref:Uncharacterized protein n=1 Tax=Cynara cardunculus var. scolymus TaxID=59895 RepID=A0A103Y329_CYNCS|nr:hypothetical protein Ccrd_020098 [Cynara cardunculus var. scolymus]
MFLAASTTWATLIFQKRNSMDARERRKFRKTVLNSSKQSLKSTSSNVEDNIPNSDRQLRSSSQRNNIPYHSENMDPNTCPQYEHTNIEHSSSTVTITNPLFDSSNDEELDHPVTTTNIIAGISKERLEIHTIADDITSKYVPPHIHDAKDKKFDYGT